MFNKASQKENLIRRRMMRVKDSPWPSSGDSEVDAEVMAEEGQPEANAMQAAHSPQ